MFLNVSNGERHAKGVKNLIAIASCADFCLLAYKVDQEPVQVRTYNQTLVHYGMCVCVYVDNSTPCCYVMPWGHLWTLDMWKLVIGHVITHVESFIVDLSFPPPPPPRT